MYFDNLEDIKQYADEIICFYSDDDPYVKYEVEKDFADKIAFEQVLIPNAGHINSESGYDTFEDIIKIIKDNPEKLDISDRKLFERKETTDILRNLIGPIVKKYNSENYDENIINEQICFF